MSWHFVTFLMGKSCICVFLALIIIFRFERDNSVINFALQYIPCLSETCRAPGPYRRHRCGPPPDQVEELHQAGLLPTAPHIHRLLPALILRLHIQASRTKAQVSEMVGFDAVAVLVVASTDPVVDNAVADVIAPASTIAVFLVLLLHVGVAVFAAVSKLLLLLLLLLL